MLHASFITASLLLGTVLQAGGAATIPQANPDCRFHRQPRPRRELRRRAVRAARFLRGAVGLKLHILKLHILILNILNYIY